MNQNGVAQSTIPNRSPFRSLFFSIPILLVSMFFLSSTTTTRHCQKCKCQKQKITRAFGLSEQNIVMRTGKSDCQHDWHHETSDIE